MHNERCTKLFVLTVLLYGALDWQFAGCGIDVETDVQLERMRQDYYHGGPAADDRLSPEGWRERLSQQVLRLEQQLSSPEDYAQRLVKLTALSRWRRKRHAGDRAVRSLRCWTRATTEAR